MKSNYIGVLWDKRARKWKATVTHNKIRYECGYHEDDREAAKLRDMKILNLGLDKSKLQILKPK